MEYCNCDLYKKVIEDCKVAVIGTLPPLSDKVKLPEDITLKWTKRLTKPIFIDNTEKKNAEKQDFDLKWIPQCSGLLSQKLANENKGIYAPF